MNQHNILEWIREYASNRINSRLIDERRCIPPYIVLDFGNKGLLGMSVQKKYGGLELNNYESVKVVEQLGSIDFSLASFVGLNNALGIRPIMKFANQSIKEELLPKLAIGRELAAFALTETDAGSNPLAIKSNAVQESVDSWRLYGKKIWSGSAAWASVINVFVKSDKGITAFALRQQKGVRQGEESLTMGLRGMVQNSIYLEGAIVSKEDQLGEEGYGMAVAQDAMMYGRLGIAAAALGSMKKCAQLMLRYASRRTISTGFLLDNPVTLTKLTEATSAINVLDTLVEEIAKFIDSNIEVPVEYYVTCKILGSEHFYKAADDLIQVMGGRGYMEPNIAPQLLRDARIARIFEGPTETLYSFLGASVLNNPQKLYQFIDTQLINQSMVTRIKTVIMQIESCIDSKSIAPTKNHWINYIIGNIICYYLSLSVLEYRYNKRQSNELTQGINWLTNIITKLSMKYLSSTDTSYLMMKPAELSAIISGYRNTIGDIDQSMAGEDNALDIMIRKNPTTYSLPNENNNSQIQKKTDLVYETDNRELEIRTWLKKQLEQNHNIVVRDDETPFSEIGLDSIKTLQFVGDIETRFDKQFPHSILWKYDNIKKLSNFLLKNN